MVWKAKNRAQISFQGHSGMAQINCCLESTSSGEAVLTAGRVSPPGAGGGEPPLCHKADRSALGRSPQCGVQWQLLPQNVEPFTGCADEMTGVLPCAAQ